MHINARNLSYTYPSSSLLAVTDLSATFSTGWTGLVGANGAGKSTLLKVLSGALEPDSGTVQPRVAGVCCEQSTDFIPTNREDFALDYSADAIRLRTLLELDDDWFWRYDTLSHGERKRVQIACALQTNPMILALDEPTNHLDTPTRTVVLKALAAYRGIGLIVSHDRAFLDALVYQCLFLESGKGVLIPGSYTKSKLQRDLENKSTATERKKARSELDRIQIEANRRKAVATQSAARRSGKLLNKHDSDGREKLRLAVVSGQDGKTGLLSTQMNKKITFAKKRFDDAWVKKRYDTPLGLHTEPSKRKVVAYLSAGSIEMGETRKLKHPSLYVGPTDKIGLRGGNGTGKTTLLRALFAKKDTDQTSLLIPQEVSPEQGREIVAAIKRLPAEELGQVLSIVAGLNSPPKRILTGDDLSPGELRKVMLAFGLLKRPEIIVMDEPTNHLDIHSIEALQAVLSTCSCALLLVSHDEQFLAVLTDIRWDFMSNPATKSTAHTNSRRDTTLTVSFT